MSTLEILKYVVFGYSFVVVGTAFTFSDSLRNPKFLKRCLMAGSVSFALGVVLEIFNLLEMERGMTIILMSMSLIYIGYFQLLSKLFRKWKGTDPYITSSSSTVGGDAIGGFWTKYPKDRKIMYSDFVFSFAQALIPIFTIAALVMLVIQLNK